MANQGSNTGSLHFKVLTLKNYSKLYIQISEESEQGNDTVTFALRTTLMTAEEKEGWRRKGKRERTGKSKFFLKAQRRGKEVAWRPWLWGSTCRHEGAVAGSNGTDGMLGRQGKEWPLGSLLASGAPALGNWVRQLAFTRVGECKMAIGVWGWDEELDFGHVILWVMGNTCTYELVPGWTPCNGFHTCSLPEQRI